MGWSWCDGLSLRNVVSGFQKKFDTSKTSTVEICWEVFSWDRPRLLVKVFASGIIWISVAKKKWHPHAFVISCTHPILGPSWANDLLVFLHTSILYSTVTCWNMLKHVFHLWCFQHNVCCQSQFKSHSVSTISYCKSPLLLVNPHCPWLLYWKDPNYGFPWVLKSCSNGWHAQMPAAKCASTQVVVVVVVD